MSKNIELLDQVVLEIKKYINNLSHQSFLKYQKPAELTKNSYLNINKEPFNDNFLSLVQFYLKNSIQTGNVRFMNQLFSGFSMPGFISEMIIALTNTSIYTYEVAPLATLIEKEMIKIMAQLSGFSNYDGTFVTGGSNANLIAIHAARYEYFPEIKQKGINQIGNLRIYISSESHYSFEKSAHIMGIGVDNVIKVPTDDLGKMIPEELENLIKKDIELDNKPFFVGATAGSTVRGSYDDLIFIKEITNKYNLWLHVDGAWGAGVLLSKKHKHLMKGIEGANSLAWDAHKMMGVPLICSVILINQSKVLHRLHNVSGMDYLFHETEEQAENDLGHLSLQCGRRVDSLKLWFMWKYYGRDGYEKQIDKLFDLSVFVQKEIINKNNSFEWAAIPISLNLCFRYTPKRLPIDISKKSKKHQSEFIDQLNIDIRTNLQKKGKLLVNYSQINGRPCFRMIIVNFNLTKELLLEFFKDIEQEGKMLVNQNK